MSTPKLTLPTDSAARKATPLARGVLDYFPAALAAVARLSQAGNDKHNPGEPLHHARGKSSDHADCILRHLVDRGTVDPEDGIRHTVKVAWRALALLQEELEREDGAPLPRGARAPAAPMPLPRGGGAVGAPPCPALQCSRRETDPQCSSCSVVAAPAASVPVPKPGDAFCASCAREPEPEDYLPCRECRPTDDNPTGWIPVTESARGPTPTPAPNTSIGAPTTAERNCYSCRFKLGDIEDPPCRECADADAWEPQPTPRRPTPAPAPVLGRCSGCTASRSSCHRCARSSPDNATDLYTRIPEDL